MKKKNPVGIAALAAMAILFAACPTGSDSTGGDGTGGDGGGTTSAVTQSSVYYGVTSDYATIELTLTPQSRSVRAITSGTRYVIKRNGTSVSTGSIQVSGVTVTFSSSSGTTFTATIGTGDVLNITTIKLDGGSTITIANLYPTTSTMAAIFADGTWSDGYMDFVKAGDRFSTKFIKAGGSYNDPVGSETRGSFTYTEKYLFRHIEGNKYIL
ncbi:MAG: hypothetical protein LBS37_00130 [Treponema sp.]|jgi:hypothetical protein|nr:hypothetical protein [Treponema sp.]